MSNQQGILIVYPIFSFNINIPPFQYCTAVINIICLQGDITISGRKDANIISKLARQIYSNIAINAGAGLAVAKVLSLNSQPFLSGQFTLEVINFAGADKRAGTV